MKIGIHQDLTGLGLGGAEFVVAVLAQSLREAHEVEIVQHRPQLTIKDFSDFFQLNLDGVGWRCYPMSNLNWADQSDRWWRLRSDQARRCAPLSEPYDLFITVTHSVPPFCHAPRGILYVLFPMFDRAKDWPWSEAVSFSWRGAINGFRRHIHDKSWQARMSTYDHRLAISRFAADWTARYWGIPCKVLSPPVACDFSATVKTDQIVILGRFSSVKKQRELVSGFRGACAALLPGWSLTCLGGLSKAPQDQAYFEEVRAAVGAASIRLLPNASRLTVRAELERSKVFWHGMGLGEDEDRDPLRLEHFGIATVEAMAAGCVPVVINKGGQKEIVEQGVSGFLCDSVEEMAETTVRLAREDGLRERMARAAVVRAQEFAKERFCKRFMEMTDLATTADRQYNGCSVP